MGQIRKTEEERKESHREAVWRYQQSKNGKKVHRKAFQKYRQSKRGREVHQKASRKYHRTEKGKAVARAYRAKRRTHLVGAELIYMVDLIARDKNVCQICGLPINNSIPEFKATLDHITPLSKGGSNVWNNVQLAHLRCNLKKYNIEDYHVSWDLYTENQNLLYLKEEK